MVPVELSLLCDLRTGGTGSLMGTLEEGVVGSKIGFLYSTLLIPKVPILFFFFPLGPIIAQKVTQDQPQVLVQEKEAVTLDCKYDTSESRYSLSWYKQPSSGGMILLIRQDSHNQQNDTEGRYSLNFQKARKSITLVISASWLEDSAVYFRALSEPTVRRVEEGPAPKPRALLHLP